MKKKQNFIYIYLLLLPIIDVITSLMTRFGDFRLSLGMVVKGLTLLFSVLYIVIWSKSKWRKKSILYLFILFAYFIIYILCKSEIWLTGNYLNEIMNSFKYFYFIVMLLGVINIFDDYKIDNDFIKRVFLIFSIMYTILLLVPAITNTAFSSYNTDLIGGDNGWFYAANETGAITVLLLLGTTYLLNNKKKWSILCFIPILLSISLIGTKVSYMGMILAVITIIIFNLLINKKEGIISSLLLLLVLIGVCNYSPAMSNLEEHNQRIEDEKKSEIVIPKKLDNYIHNEALARLVKLGLNGREEFFLNNVDIYAETSIEDKLFGLGWSNCDSEETCDYYNKMIEIDYLDVYFRYGIVGFIIYFIPIIYTFIIFFKSKKELQSYYYFIFLLIGLLVSSIAGHVLSAPAVSIYLVLIIYMLNNSYSFKINEKEVTILALHLGHGGVEKYISSLSLMLEDNYDINIISTYKLSKEPVYHFSDKVKITYLIAGGPNKEAFKNAIKEKNILNIIKEGLKSIKILYLRRKRNIKAIKNIHSKYIITTRIFHNNLVSEYANNNIIKIATEHNYHDNNKKYYHKVINSIRNFDYFVLVSKPLLEFYKDKVNAKCVYIPNTIDYLPKEETKLKEDVLISVGRLEKEKGFDDLIDVIKLVKEKKNNIKLYLIGDGSLKKDLNNKIKENNLDNNIIMTGYGDRELIAKYMSKSKLYVMTSHTESFGIVLIEAMSYKVPCIAFDCANGARELLKNNVGILIKDRDKQKMANEIIRLLNDNVKLKTYSQKGYDKCQEFLVDNVKNDWLKIIK